MKKVLLIFCFLFFIILGQTYAASDRYIVEQHLTGLAQQTVDSMFGEGNFIVRVQAQMTDSQYSVRSVSYTHLTLPTNLRV